MKILIFANGIMADVEWIRPYLNSATHIIAADGGTRHLHRLQIPPQTLIGDLDSLSLEMRQWLQIKKTEIIAYPAAKDESDLELALLYAVDHFPDAPILLFGLLGGRLDHTLANILLLSHPHLRHCAIKIVREFEEAWLMTSAGVVHGHVGDIVSLIPIGGAVRVHTTSGLQWPLQAETLSIGPARGISNRLTAPTARVEIESGQLLCIHQTKDPAQPAGS